MTCAMTRRCHCWKALGLVVALGFAVLEERGYRARCAHRTLSRELRLLLGRRGCWLFAVLGAVFSVHLARLAEQEA